MPTKTSQSEMQKVPKLRFGGFSGAWEEKKLGEVADFRRGSFPQPYGLPKWYDDENGFPFVQVYDVGEDFKLKGITKRRITDAAKKLSVWVEKGTIVLTIQGSIGRIALTQYDACVDRTLLIFKSFRRPVDKIFFLYIVFLLFEIEKKKAPGGTIKTITKEVLSSFKISLPPLPEQQKIAEFLGGVDEWIENLREQKENLESYKKGMMQKIFSQEIRFRDDEGKEFPMWEEKKLSEISEIIMGQSPDSSSYSIDGNGKYLIQGNADIDGRVTAPRNWTTQITKECRVGDIIMTVRAPVGYIAKSLSDACIGRGVCAIRSKKSSDTDFLYQFLLSYEEKWAKYSQGSTFTAVNSKDVRDLKILTPTLSEQQKISEFLGSIDKVLESKEQQITQAEQWKRGLMQGLFV